MINIEEVNTSATVKGSKSQGIISRSEVQDKQGFKRVKDIQKEKRDLGDERGRSEGMDE